ncbi:unnamed protein product [Moneuplotes crassus]|uniref:Glutathione S-transferase n=1 Tax=Euplotes crassus TaxID=5936 RepID=A0AAD2D0V5_EUPCR|nr:unnamed protein product [Moneuplotes crassus]
MISSASKSIPSKIKLSYFPFHGRVEPIRMLLLHKGVEFEDDHVDLMGWIGGSELKQEAEYGQLPILEYGEKKYVQSVAIMRFLARQFGYYPLDDFEKQYEVDNVMDSFSDYNFGLIKAYTATEVKAKNEGLKSFFSTHSMTFFKSWDTRIKENGTGYAVGDSWTAADFSILAITHTMYTHSHWNHMYDNLLDSYTTLKDYTETRIADFGDKLSSRPEIPVNFIFQKKVEYFPEEDKQE